MALMVMSDILEIQEDYDKAIEILGQIPDNILSEEKKQARISSIKKQFVPSGGRTVSGSMSNRQNIPVKFTYPEGRRTSGS